MLCYSTEREAMTEQVEEIMGAQDWKYAITTFEATSLSKEVKPALKKTQAQNLLDSYVAKGMALSPFSSPVKE